MARGTVYNNLRATDSLFERIASELNSEMSQRIRPAPAADTDPALRLAHGTVFLRRTHGFQPEWGRFLCRFALNNSTLLTMWNGPAMADLQHETRRIPSFPDAGAPVADDKGADRWRRAGRDVPVLKGHKSREAGADGSSWCCVARGLRADEARLLG